MFLTILEHIAKQLTFVGNKSFSNVRLFDSENRDITDQLEYCGNPSCLGEPWCSAFGICKAQEPAVPVPEQAHYTLNY